MHAKSEFEDRLQELKVS